LNYPTWVIIIMKVIPVRKPSQRGLKLFVSITSMLVLLALSLMFLFTSPVAAAPFAADPPLCGDGSAPDYGFSYEMQQAHWTVDWQDYASEQAVTDVDVILDQLDSDSIVQTMILIKPQAEVGNRVNCAVHFLRYMQLGQPTGERKDNGFVFLIVVEPDRIDVHYGVGLGLPALTASELTTLNRTAEAAFQSSHSLDQALLALVQGFDSVARNKYAPLASAEETLAPNAEPVLPSGPLGFLAICGQLCLGTLVVLFLLWGARRGIPLNMSGWGSGRSFGGGRGGILRGGGGTMRGGGGSGRSGRGN